MIEHLVISTITALAAIVAVLTLRRQRASVRHTILLIAILGFVLPTPVLTEAGGSLGRYLPARTAALPVFGGLSKVLRQAPAEAIVLPSAERPQPIPWLRIGALVLWAAGTAIYLTVWVRRAGKNIPAVRDSSPGENESFGRAKASLGMTRSVELRITSAGNVPGALGWWNPCVIVPDGLAAELREAELQAVLAHELAHILRRDNFWATCARIVVSVFWFHPLLWWMERRSLEERETACDELVMARGTLAEDYIAGIVKVCRTVLAADSGYAGITGASLKNRMEHIMSANFSRSTSWFMHAIPGMLLAFAMLVPMGRGLLQAQAPSADEALYQSGRAAFNTRDFAGAEQIFRRLHAMYPADARAVGGIAEVYMAQKKESDAIELLRTEIEKDPQRSDYHLILGNLLVRTKEYGPAISEYQNVLDRTSKDSQAASDIYFRMGESYRRSGNLEEARAQFQRAADTAPGNANATLQVALLLEAAGQPQDVAEQYRAVLKLDPNNAVALNNLAYRLAEDGGDLDMALEYAQRARQVQPDSENVADTLGWIYLKKGMPDEAIVSLGQAMRKNQSSVPIRSHLAAALDQKTDAAPWMQELKVALRRDYAVENERRITELLQNIGK